MLKIKVKDRSGIIHIVSCEQFEEPNLMEVLKSRGFKMRATCGGMGLCADCHCNVLERMEHISGYTEQELETLDSLPDLKADSRLCCQIIPDHRVDGLYFELLGVDH